METLENHSMNICRIKIIFFFLGVFIFQACQQNEPPEKLQFLPEEKKITKNNQTITVVETQLLQPRDFSLEITSIGTITASRFVNVTFPLSLPIEMVDVKVGQKVKKGQLLAKLNHFNQEQELAKLKVRIQQAEMELDAMLIGRGYEPSEKDSVPELLLNNLILESNLPALEIDQALLEKQIQDCYIKAPLDGVVVDVEGQEGGIGSSYPRLCKIIDQGSLEVLFPILESELISVKEGNALEVIPLYNQSKRYTGRVTKIRPQVNEDGSILVYAKINGLQEGLLDGMSVKVLLKKTIPRQLVVPKTAVLDRQDRLVAFTVKSGLAHWNYVEVGLENTDQYTIKAGVNAGDTIIVSNTFNLAHLQELKILNQD